MKTRENELHEIKIEKLQNSSKVKAICPVCGDVLFDTYNGTDLPDKVLLFSLIPNYCSNCGARLKEI